MNIAESKRLELREFSKNDVNGFFELNNDPIVLKYTGDSPFRDKLEVMQFIDNYQHYDENGFGRWSVYLKENDQYIGFCGLRKCHISEDVDIGFRIKRAFWGQGYASEAADLCLRLGFKRFALNDIVARAMEDNQASHALIKKLGMTFESCYQERGKKWLKYSINQQHYLKKCK
ncbi:N-acetyltransferase [Shewanella sp. OPT22]|nr:N-acetyltransferase [Shewanella sp. OPT22]